MQQADSVSVPPLHGVPRMRFSTDDFPQRQRLSAWREIFARSLVKIDVEPKTTEQFRSEATVTMLPGLDVMFGSCSPVQAIHSRELIDDDDLSIMIGPWEKWTASMLGREPVLGAGDGVLMWNAEVGSMAFPTSTPFCTFRMPSAAIRPLVPDLGAVVARQIPAQTEALRLLRHYLEAFREPASVTSPAVLRLAATHSYDLLALALGATRDAAHIAEGRGVRAARLRAIKSDLLVHLGQPDLTVVTVAKRQGVTPRYVQQLFDSEGTTFSRFVRELRLTQAHRMLANPCYAALNISRIAYDSGFGDLSYFNRIFQTAFGVTPSDVRAAARRDNV
jgi:AraC-like DNA-binding protein